MDSHSIVATVSNKEQKQIRKHRVEKLKLSSFWKSEQKKIEKIVRSSNIYIARS